MLVIQLRRWLVPGCVATVIGMLQVVPAAATPDLLIGSPDTNSVLRFDGDTGALIGDFVAPGAGGLQHPGGLAFGPDGLLYVSDAVGNKVLRFHGESGAFVDVFSDASGLVGPTDLHFHGDDLFVGLWSNATFRGGVARLDAQSGALEMTFGTSFGRTNGLDFGPDGNLYTNDFDLRRIRVYDPTSGTQIRSFGGLAVVGQPMAISFEHDGHLLVTDWRGGLRRVDPVSGTLITQLVSGLNNALSHITAPDGSLLADSFFDHTLTRYDAQTGVSLGQFIDVQHEPEMFIYFPVPEPGGGVVGFILAVGLWMTHRRSLPFWPLT